MLTFSSLSLLSYNQRYSSLSAEVGILEPVLRISSLKSISGHNFLWCKKIFIIAVFYLFAIFSLPNTQFEVA